MRHAVVLLLATLLACAHPRATPVPVSSAPSARTATLDDMLRDDLASEHAFAWSPRRRLVWGDFQGPPATGGREGAKTAYTLFYAWRCRGDAFQFQTIAAFRPRASWVKPAIVRDTMESRRALQHEQTHFDLSEIGARRLRRSFAQLAAPCRKSDDELGALARRVVDEEKAEQRRYDDETEHGLAARRQGEWTAQTARRLAEP
jgi:hypothetical protein